MALAYSTAAQCLPMPTPAPSCRLQLPRAPRASGCLTLSSSAPLASRCVHAPGSDGLHPWVWAALVP